jgi:hypothetical protein
MVWNNIKDWIQEHYPDIHRSYKRLRQVVQEAWEVITHERIKELIRTMPQQHQDITDADRGPTK